MPYYCISSPITFLIYYFGNHYFLLSLLFMPNDFIFWYWANPSPYSFSSYSSSHKSKEDSSSAASFDTPITLLLTWLSTICIHDYITWSIIHQTILPNKFQISKTVLNKEVGILPKLFHDSGKIHRILYYRGIVQNIQFYIIHRVFKWLTFLVAPDVLNYESQSCLLFHLHLSLLRHGSN